MEVIRSAEGFRDVCERVRSDGRSLGFVPTMGAFHDGHVSLIERARAESDTVAVSIFVNPLQFANERDSDAYPRDEVRDLRIAEELGVDFVFVPSVDEMEPGGTPEVTVDPGPLGERFEGASRPGHLRGVATVVARLFNLSGGCSAYFGEKDAQQLAVVRRMVDDLGFPVSVVACPTVRDPVGLALSSRNRLLSPEQREAAGCLFLALSEAARMTRGGEREPARLLAAMAREVGATSEARLDYAAVVDAETFAEVRGIEAPARALVAAWFGQTRLIDNLLLPI